MFKHFDYLETVDSTNTYLKQFTEQGVPRIVVAREQTAGRGQHGRGWYSPARKGLYVSYLLYPGWEAAPSSFLNVMSALAVVRAIRQEAQGRVPLTIKAPNDVLIGEKKFCGILIELGSLTDRIDWTIIGIGINLYQGLFPDELENRATSLALEGVAVSHPLDLCDRLTRELEKVYRQLDEGQWGGVSREFEREQRGALEKAPVEGSEVRGQERG